MGTGGVRYKWCEKGDVWSFCYYAGGATQRAWWGYGVWVFIGITQTFIFMDRIQYHNRGRSFRDAESASFPTKQKSIFLALAKPIICNAARTNGSPKGCKSFGFLNSEQMRQKFSELGKTQGKNCNILPKTSKSARKEAAHIRSFATVARCPAFKTCLCLLFGFEKWGKSSPNWAKYKENLPHFKKNLQKEQQAPERSVLIYVRLQLSRDVPPLRPACVYYSALRNDPIAKQIKEIGDDGGFSIRTSHKSAIERFTLGWIINVYLQMLQWSQQTSYFFLALLYHW